MTQIVFTGVFESGQRIQKKTLKVGCILVIHTSCGITMLMASRIAEVVGIMRLEVMRDGE